MVRYLSFSLGALVLAMAVLHPTRIDSQVAEDSKTSLVVQSNEDAAAQDVALVAAANGWTREQAASDHRAANVIGRIAEQVAAERPEIFVGSVLSPEPGGAPMLYIKGPADEFVRALAGKAEMDITIVDDQPLSFGELEERKIQVHRALEALGFRYVSSEFSVTGLGQIEAGVTRQTGLPDDAADILSALPEALRAGVALTISDSPIAVDLDSFGGMWMRQDGVNKCTSGWSVWNLSSGATGVTTAGHCTGINQIDQPGVGVGSQPSRGSTAVNGAMSNGTQPPTSSPRSSTLTRPRFET